MKRLWCFLALGLLLAVGCASNLEPTGAPVNAVPNATAAQFAPQAVSSPAAPLRPSSTCQSRVMGRVVDASGALVKGATVELRGGTLRGSPPRAVSDDNGLYGFAGLCAGTYTFTVTPPGKKAVTLGTNVNVDGANPAKADLALK